MTAPRSPSSVSEPLRQALEALETLRHAAERAACAALFIESIQAAAALGDAADFDGVTP